MESENDYIDIGIRYTLDNVPYDLGRIRTSPYESWYEFLQIAFLCQNDVLEERHSMSIESITFEELLLNSYTNLHHKIPIHKETMIADTFEPIVIDDILRIPLLTVKIDVVGKILTVGKHYSRAGCACNGCKDILRLMFMPYKNEYTCTVKVKHEDLKTMAITFEG